LDDLTLSSAASRTKLPQQRRSRERFERVLDATELLLCESDNGEFTIQEVAARSGVSVGVIYTRVQNKDDLIHLAQQRIIMRVQQEEHGLEGLPKPGASLDETVAAVIEGFASFLYRNAEVLRPVMNRASIDPEVAHTGNTAHARMMLRFIDALLQKRSRVLHPAPAAAGDACFRMVYATLTRYLCLGAAPARVGRGEWNAIKRDLIEAMTLFLAAPRRR